MSDQQKQAKTHAAITSKGSALSKYQAVMVGSTALGRTMYFEFCSWLTFIPGAIGLLLRKVLWPRLFARCGRGVQFGQGVILRHPGRISIADHVVISENVILDARNDQLDIAIHIGAEVMLANSVSLSAKGGSIDIGARTGIGAQTIIQSTNDCAVSIGADNIIGPRCYLVGGGSYNIDDLDIPMAQQGIKPDGGCSLADNVWLGGNVTVLGGVAMASGSVAAAAAVVNRSIDANQICAGVPARVIRSRGGQN